MRSQTAVMQALNEKRQSFVYHDLYGERFNPVLPYREISRGARLDPVIQAHCAEIAAADGIVVIHPDWWGQPGDPEGVGRSRAPPGVAYRFLEGDSGEGVPVGLLKAGAALVFNTSNTPREREIKAFGDPLDRLWKDCIFSLCGVPVIHRRMFSVVVTSTEDERRRWLEEVRDMVRGNF